MKLTEGQKDLIIRMIKDDFECGMVNAEAFAVYIKDDEDFVDSYQEAANFYAELASLGPAGMLDDYPNLDWDEDFVISFGGYRK